MAATGDPFCFRLPSYFRKEVRLSIDSTLSLDAVGFGCIELCNFSYVVPPEKSTFERVCQAGVSGSCAQIVALAFQVRVAALDHVVGAPSGQSFAGPDSELVTHHFAGSRVALHHGIEYLLLNREVVNLLDLVDLLGGLLQLFLEQLVLLLEIIYFLDIYFIEFSMRLVSFQ